MTVPPVLSPQTQQAKASTDEPEPSVTLYGTVPQPLLWAPGSPNLYHVRVEVSEAGTIKDAITQPLGFHKMEWDLKKGTVQVNGKPIILYGVDLHQEIEKKASAVEPEDLIANFDAMKDLGVNFVRLPHYPHAELEYDLCDQRGLFCWAENGHTNNDQPSPTADQITTEMVEQNFNHPSIAIWSVGNESTEDVANREVPLVKALDTTRPVMVANMKCALADYRGGNIYPGWYGGDRWKVRTHGLISEIGAGGAVTSHTDYAVASHKVDSFEPEEYQQLVAETEMETAFRHSDGKLGLFCWWTMREFNDFKYKKAEAPFKHGINTKGLETFAGDKKDVYYLYRSFLRPKEPTLHITSKRYFLRQGAPDNGIKVYSNAKSVTLTLNGQTVSTLQNGQYAQNDPENKTGSGEIDNVFYWPVPLQKGKNLVSVKDDRNVADSAILYYDAPGDQPPSSPTDLIKDLSSSNPANPVYWMDMPVQPQWPFYCDFDSTGDNSLDLLPDAINGASWLALHRVTKPGEATTVKFALTSPATVFVMCTKMDSPPQLPGFSEVAAGPLSWRADDLILTSAQLYSKQVAAGESVSLDLGDRDALVLMKGN
jgi:beta-galactosidase